MSRRTFFVSETFVFGLVRRPGTYNGQKKYGPGRRTKPKIKVDNTKKVRLDMGVRESWLGWRFRRNRWSTDMSKIEHVSLNSEDEILDRVNSETLNYSGLYSKNSENENFETCSHLYLTYQHRTINLIDFSGGNVKTDVFRFRNFCFRFSTASRDV